MSTSPAESKDYKAADGIVVIDTRTTDEPIESVSAIAATTGITASAVVDATNSTVSMIFITDVTA